MGGGRLQYRQDPGLSVGRQFVASHGLVHNECFFIYASYDLEVAFPRRTTRAFRQRREETQTPFHPPDEEKINFTRRRACFRIAVMRVPRANLMAVCVGSKARASDFALNLGRLPVPCFHLLQTARTLACPWHPRQTVKAIQKQPLRQQRGNNVQAGWDLCPVRFARDNGPKRRHG